MIRATHSVYEKYDFEDINEKVIYGYDTQLRGYFSAGIKIKPFQ